MAECWSAVAALLPFCELKTASSLHHLFLLFFSYIPYITGCPNRLTDTSLSSNVVSCLMFFVSFAAPCAQLVLLQWTSHLGCISCARDKS